MSGEDPMAEIPSKALLRMHRRPISGPEFSKQDFQHVIESEILRRATEAI